MWLSDEEQKILDSAKYEKEIKVSIVNPVTIIGGISSLLISEGGFEMILNGENGYREIGLGLFFFAVILINHDNHKFRKNAYSLLRKLYIKANLDN